MTKSNSAKKSRSGKKHSKLSLMRKKLTLRRKMSPIHYDVQDTEERTSNEDMAEGDDVEEGHEEQAIVLSQAKTKKLLHRASPMKLVSLYPYISEDQKTMIREADYGGLLDIKCSKLQPELCKFLMESFDPETCSMVFPGRGAIPITELSVKEVLGVPCGTLEVIYEVDSETTKFMHRKLGNEDRKQPTITFLKKKLMSMKNADTSYLRLFITLGMASVLAPTTGANISPRLYPSMVKIKQAKKLNVCKFVIMMIRKATKSNAEKAILKSCMLYLMVKYLDSLELKDMNISKQGTRVAVWTNAMIKKAMQQDIDSNGCFGMAALKTEFTETERPESSVQKEASKQSGNEGEQELSISGASNTQCREENRDYDEGQTILFSDTQKIDKFIEINAPPDRTQEDTARYKHSVMFACHSFEASLQMLMKNLVPKPVKQQPITTKSNYVSSNNELGKASNKEGCNQTHMCASDKDEDKNQEAEAVDQGQNFDDGGDSLIETNTVKQTCDQEEVADLETEIANPIVTSMDGHGQGVSTQGRLKDLNTEQTLCKEDDASQYDKDRDVTDLVGKEQDGLEENSRKEGDATISHVVPGLQGDVADPSVAKLENSKPDTVASLLAYFAEQKSKHDDLIEGEPVQLTEMKTKSSLGIKDVDYITPESSTKMLHTHDSSSRNEDQGEDNTEYGSAQFMEFLRGSPAVPKFKHPVYEPHEFLDMEWSKPNSTNQVTQDLLKTLPRYNLEEAAQGLESFSDETARLESAKLIDDIVPKAELKKRKRVSSADQTPEKTKTTAISTSPIRSPSRYRTRSVVRGEASSNQKDGTTEIGDIAAVPNVQKHASPRHSISKEQSPSGRTTSIITRSETRVVRGNAKDDLVDSKLTSNPSSAPQTTTNSIPSSAFIDSMNRKLDFDSTDSERKKREAIRLAPDAPFFDLCTPPEDESTKEETTVVVHAGCSKPQEEASSFAITQVGHEYQKRVSKVGKFEKSPFVNYKTQKNYNVTKPVETVYNMVCQHGFRSGSRTNDEIVVDVGRYYITVGNLADSVKPGKKLMNMVAEVGIHIIKEENTNTAKYIMPLRVAEYLIESRFDLKDVTRCFEITPTNKIDEKEVVCSPTLQKLTNIPTDQSGHYWLVVLNIKAQRFEIIDSLSKNGEALMMHSCHVLVAGIKIMWERYFKDSKVQIANWPIEIMESPKQTNTYDYGFFTLKNLEEKNGRKVPTYTQKDMQNIRKIFTDKWLRFEKKKATWQLYI